MGAILININAAEKDGKMEMFTKIVRTLFRVPTRRELTRYRSYRVNGEIQPRVRKLEKKRRNRKGVVVKKIGKSTGDLDRV